MDHFEAADFIYKYRREQRLAQHADRKAEATRILSRITSGAFPIHADYGDHLWATQDEIDEKFRDETTARERPDWVLALDFGLVGAMIFTWQVDALTKRMDALFTNRRLTP